MMNHIKQLIIYIVGVLLLLWGIGFCGFCFYAITLKYSADIPVEGVVVLTGGVDRIQTAGQKTSELGLNALLISGVNKSVSPDKILKQLSVPDSCQITLGYWAENTAQNAVEVSNWVLKNDFHSVLLVTSFYHMPRAMFEILKHNKSLAIVPYPVFPKTFNNSVEWVRTKYAWFLFLEYNKFIAVHLMSLIRSVVE